MGKLENVRASLWLLQIKRADGPSCRTNASFGEEIKFRIKAVIFRRSPRCSHSGQTIGVGAPSFQAVGRMLLTASFHGFARRSNRFLCLSNVGPGAAATRSSPSPRDEGAGSGVDPSSIPRFPLQVSGRADTASALASRSASSPRTASVPHPFPPQDFPRQTLHPHCLASMRVVDVFYSLIHA